MGRISEAQRRSARKALLRAAALQFAEAGFDRASVDQISLAAGFAKGTLYNYFPNKAELFAAVIEEGARLAAERYAAAAAELDGSTRERLLALAQADVSVMREEEAFTKVLIREAMSFRPQTYPLVVKGLAPFMGQVVAVLRAGAEAGAVRGERAPSEYALTFVGLLSLTYVQHWGTSGQWPPLAEIPEIVVSQFLEGAAPR